MDNRRPVSRVIPLVVACPLFMQNLDTSLVAIALPAISRALQVDVLSLNLAIAAYLLSLAIALPISGWLAERFGARRVFCVAILLFCLGSGLCALASSLGELVAFRLLQGLGGAMMLPVARLLILRLVPPAELVSAMVWFTIPATVGRMIGPAIGGTVVTFATWHWVFLVGVPFGIAGIAMALRWVPKDPPRHLRQVSQFDVKGFVLLASALAGMLGGLELARKGLLPDYVLLALVIGGALAFYVYLKHSRSHAAPIIDFKLLKHATYRASVLGGTPLRIAIGAGPFLLPLLLQIGFNIPPLQAGLLLMATAIGSLGTRAIARDAIRRVSFRTLLMTATVLVSCTYAAYGLFTPDTPYWIMFTVLLAGGLCNGMVMLSLATMGFSEIPEPQLGQATALSTIVQQLALSVGVVASAAILASSNELHGGDGHHFGTNDFMPAFASIAALTLLPLFWFRRLSPDAGDELRRHR